jgi:hypothetical protein
MQNASKTPAVSIVPNKDSNQVITAYTSNAEFGYIQLEQKSMEFQGGWMRVAKRSCLLRAETEVLTQFVAMNKSLQLPGKIAVQEYAEDKVPQEIQTRFLNTKKNPYEEVVDQYIKRAGNDGPVLMTGDQRILRFSFYDPTGLVPDVFTAHDNAAEASAPTTQAAEQVDAVLPTGAVIDPVLPAGAPVVEPAVVAGS